MKKYEEIYLSKKIEKNTDKVSKKDIRIHIFNIHLKGFSKINICQDNPHNTLFNAIVHIEYQWCITIIEFS